MANGFTAELSPPQTVAEARSGSFQTIQVRRRFDSPVTPGASPRAQALLTFLAETYGKRILSGQQDGAVWPGQPEFELDLIQKATGTLPAILAFEMSPFTPPAEGSQPRVSPTVIARATDWYQKSNGIVALCWHWNAPVGPPRIYTKDTAFDFRGCLVEGTPEHAALLRDLDVVAGELEKLQAAGVPVLWRPLHEANGRWFWWGAQGPEPFKVLWRLMFERFVGFHRLHNLIWVFSPGCATDLAAWYPGDAYVDILGQDHYPMDGNHEPAADVFQQLVAFGDNHKLVGMAENGPIPDPEGLVSRKVGWLFFVTWSGSTLTQFNTIERLAAAYRHPYVLNLDGLPDLKSYPFKPTGQAVKLGFTRMPCELAVGGPARQPIAVAIEDAEGRIVREESREITLVSALPGGSSSGAWKASTVNGVAVFPELKFPVPVAGCVLQAAAPGLEEAQSAPFDVGPGQGMLREWWTNVARVRVAALTNHPAFTLPPSGREVVAAAFEVPYSARTNFGERFRGCVVPPRSGSYSFQVVADGAAELWLSSDSTPGRKTKIAEITRQTPYSKWPHSHEGWSSPVPLEAGRSYYLELLHIQEAGLAQLWVGWRLPDGVWQAPIPGARLVCPKAEGIALKQP